jgi:hypothetical protein
MASTAISIMARQATSFVGVIVLNVPGSQAGAVAVKRAQRLEVGGDAHAVLTRQAALEARVVAQAPIEDALAARRRAHERRRRLLAIAEERRERLGDAGRRQRVAAGERDPRVAAVPLRRQVQRARARHDAARVQVGGDGLVDADGAGRREPVVAALGHLVRRVGGQQRGDALGVAVALGRL